MFSLVVPVYKNEENIKPLVAALQKISGEIEDEFEVVFVVDGSPDNSFQLLRDALPECGFSSQLVALSRNFGAFAAIRAGLEHARGDTMAVMAADLQEPPELLVEMHKSLTAGECDVAYGERARRQDGFVTTMLSKMFWSFYRRVVSSELPRGGVDIFGCTAQVRDQVLALDERNSSLVGLLFWVGFKRKGIPYERAKREIGTSAWTFFKKWKYMQDSVFSFSDLPISLLLAIGFFGLIFSTTIGVVVFVAAFIGEIEVPGYAPTMLAIIFFGTLQILSIGVLGVYLWRVFENTKGRPLHIVMSSEEFNQRQKERSEQV